MSIEEISTANDQRHMKDVLCHCRTKCNIKMTTFLWSIDNFWKIYSYMDTLTSSDIEGQSYKIDIHIDKENDKLRFFIRSINPKDEFDIYKYNICIQSVKGTALQTNWKRFHLNNDLLYEVCIQTLRQNQTAYLPKNTLSLRFMFESVETVLYNTMYENILRKQQLTATNFISDESNSFVTFIINEERFRIKKLLVCATSSVLNDRIEECNTEDEENEIKITDISLDIFRLIISYIEMREIFELIFDTDIFTDYKDYKDILLELLATAHRLDMKDLKVICEKRLIKYITKDNVVEYLDIAIKMNAIYLENYVKRLIKLHFDDIMNTTEFLDIIKINPQVLADILKQELFEEKLDVINI